MIVCFWSSCAMILLIVVLLGENSVLVCLCMIVVCSFL